MAVFKYITILLLPCISIALSDDSVVDSGDELVFAHILFRHGDRNIANSYPNDPWQNESYWPGGYGALTDIGRQQEFELGVFNRKRYFNLLPNNGSYDADNVYVQSANVERVIISAAYNLAGMFHPDEEFTNSSELWQAIHVLATKNDNILAMKKVCALYDQTYKTLLQSNVVKGEIEKNKTLFEYLTNYTGKTVKTVNDVKNIYDTLFVEQLKNLTLPSWTDSVLVSGGDMEKLANFAFTLQTKTQLLARLKAGWLLKAILQRFNAKINGTLSPDRSLWIYSGQDTTIANILNALDLFEPPQIPGYASCVYFELHKANGTYHVELYYKKYRGDYELEPLYIPNCGTKCPLDQFSQIYEDIIPTGTFTKECAVTS